MPPGNMRVERSNPWEPAQEKAHEQETAGVSQAEAQSHEGKGKAAYDKPQEDPAGVHCDVGCMQRGLKVAKHPGRLPDIVTLTGHIYHIAAHETYIRHGFDELLASFDSGDKAAMPLEQPDLGKGFSHHLPGGNADASRRGQVLGELRLIDLLPDKCLEMLELIQPPRHQKLISCLKLRFCARNENRFTPANTGDNAPGAVDQIQFTERLSGDLLAIDAKDACQLWCSPSGRDGRPPSALHGKLILGHQAGRKGLSRQIWDSLDGENQPNEAKRIGDGEAYRE